MPLVEVQNHQTKPFVHFLHESNNERATENRGIYISYLSEPTSRLISDISQIRYGRYKPSIKSQRTYFRKFYQFQARFLEESPFSTCEFHVGDTAGKFG